LNPTRSSTRLSSRSAVDVCSCACVHVCMCRVHVSCACIVCMCVFVGVCCVSMFKLRLHPQPCKHTPLPPTNNMTNKQQRWFFLVALTDCVCLWAGVSRAHGGWCERCVWAAGCGRGARDLGGAGDRQAHCEAGARAVAVSTRDAPGGGVWTHSPCATV